MSQLPPDPLDAERSGAGPETVPPAEKDPAPEAPATTDDPLRGSLTSGAWAGVIATAVLLVLLIIFIAQNTEQTTVRFLGFEGDTPLAVALLIATVLGMAVAGLVGTLRILQLRRRVKRER